jgi:hypothetical protein
MQFLLIISAPKLVNLQGNNSIKNIASKNLEASVALQYVNYRICKKIKQERLHIVKSLWAPKIQQENTDFFIANKQFSHIRLGSKNCL